MGWPVVVPFSGHTHFFMHTYAGQSVGRAEPSGQYWPLGQSIHCSQAVKPVLLLYKPTWHGLACGCAFFWSYSLAFSCILTLDNPLVEQSLLDSTGL